MVRRVLDAATDCAVTNKDYDSKNRRQNKGRPELISPVPVEEDLLALWVDTGLGFRNTTIMINQHFGEEELGFVGRNCVMNIFDRMNHIL